MLEEIFANVRKAHSFSFETTLSGRSYSRHIPEWRSSGYKVKLFYLRLATPELAIVRVRKRVMLGGHDVPEHIIRRRFVRGWENFKNIYMKEGKRKVKRLLDYYNLDMIISVGYRVKSLVATRFRIWATQNLTEFIKKGFVLDDEQNALGHHWSYGSRKGYWQIIFCNQVFVIPTVLASRSSS